jgi:hypothetical protein
VVDRGELEALSAPVRGGFFDLSAGYTSAVGISARGDLGWHLSDSVSAFGFGELERGGFGAGVGIRGTF